MPRLTSRTLMPLTLPLLLLACSQHPTTRQDDLGPYANGAQHPWTFTAPAGRLNPQRLDPERNTLMYERILDGINGWGPIETNMSNGEQLASDGRTLTVQGRTWAKGYGVHPRSYLSYSLESTLKDVYCTSLDGFVGVDDEVGDRGSVEFFISADGQLLWRSGVMTGAMPAKGFKVDITGYKFLELQVSDGGDNTYFDHADWLDPAVHCAVMPPTVSGSVDAAFGEAGRVNVGGVDSVAAPDGSVVVLGQAFGLTRLAASGTVLRRAAAPFSAQDTAKALTLQPDGKIVAVGKRTLVDGNTDFFIARFNADLSVDTTFGQGGQVITNLSGVDDPSFHPESANDVAIAPDGKIVVAGASRQTNEVRSDLKTSAFTVLRLLPDGSRDRGFGTDGVALRTFNTAGSYNQFNAHAFGNAVAVLPDGRVVVAGRVFGERGGVARFLADGRPDQTFGTAGRVWNLASCGKSNANALALSPTGDILVGGGEFTAFVSRINASGTTAAETCIVFGRLNDVNESYSTVTSLALMSDGRMVAGGTYGDGRNTSSAVLARFKPNLSFDASFGASGMARIPATDGMTVSSLLAQSDGKVVVTTGPADVRGAAASGVTFRILP
ncbi:NPCBM/NEW2 domain-containing protein [Deinococcus koreensis]|nr:NPCBM/NEW2 domain-containing protein [Deinococcus koreensis]